MTTTAPELTRILDRIGAVRVLCIGDVMLDRFIYGNVERISPEAPIPIFTATREERMLGGAGNVVRNLLSLGAEASFAAVVGDDNVATQLTGLVGSEKHLMPYLITERGRISTKKRAMSRVASKSCAAIVKPKKRLLRTQQTKSSNSFYPSSRNTKPSSFPITARAC